MKDLTHYEGLHCANCGTPMQGEFCHECGQSIHSVLKPMHGMIEETMETVLHIDGRIVHTLPPLLLKPGFLTLEYFRGRRIRYIAPFRLMFVLSLLAFFLLHLAVNNNTAKIKLGNAPSVNVSADQFGDAANAGEVRDQLKEKLADLEDARKIDALPHAALDKLDIAEQEIRQQANQRLLALGAAPMSAASLAAPPAASSIAPAPAEASSRHGSTADIQDSSSGTESSSVHVPAWLPDVLKARLTVMGEHMLANWRAFRHGDAAARAEAKERVIGGIFSALPPTMFVLIPVFALLLKLFYVFRRRLYMEHLIVSLHSHAFLFFWLLLLTLLAMLAHWVEPHALWLTSPLNWLERILVLWAPIYLLLMQKRIYGQGWPMTLFKFWCIGWCYFWLIIIALTIAGVLGLAY